MKLIYSKPHKSAITLFLGLWLVSIALLGCSPKQQEIREITGFAQGTSYSIKYWTENKKLNPIELKGQLSADIQKELDKIDVLLSNYRNDSVIEKFNNEHRIGLFKVDSELTNLLDIAKEINQKTNGCYEPTIQPLFATWGFMNKDKKFSPPSSNEIREAVSKIGLDKLTFEKGVITKLTPDITLSLSSMGEGYTSTKISQILENNNIKNYLIYFGGDTLISGKKPDSTNWTIAVENPLAPGTNKYSNIINNTNGSKIAVMTSGTYRHYFDENGKRYSHIMNPRTGYPVEHNTVAATVLYNNGIYADAFATSFVCLGEEEGLRVANKYNIPVVFYQDIDNKIKKTFSNATKSSDWEIN